ncbi:MAG: TetR/AcrR family transcriptional regulator [Lachnospiraceae bacterium]|nr:TetR/AcrR family transcriptional regulator [Lachnospiraceae bacterium]
MIINSGLNQKTQFIRTCIGEAIIALLADMDFTKLKVSDIVKKAGVARATFYKYYESPYAALRDYIEIIIGECVANDPGDQVRDTYMEREHILYTLNHFDQYADCFLTLARQGLHGIMLDSINRFMEKNIETEIKTSMYELYSYAGGLLNTFLKWEESGKQDSAEEVANMLYDLYVN